MDSPPLDVEGECSICEMEIGAFLTWNDRLVGYGCLATALREYDAATTRAEAAAEKAAFDARWSTTTWKP